MFADCQSFVGVSSNERVENKRQVARYRFCWSFYVIFTIATHVSRKPHFRTISSTILAYMCSFVFAVPVVGSDLRALPRGRALGYFVVTRLQPTSFSRCVNDRTKNTDRDRYLRCIPSPVGLPQSIRFYLERILPFDILKVKTLKKGRSNI